MAEEGLKSWKGYALVNFSISANRPHRDNVQDKYREITEQKISLTPMDVTTDEPFSVEVDVDWYAGGFGDRDVTSRKIKSEQFCIPAGKYEVHYSSQFNKGGDDYRERIVLPEGVSTCISIHDRTETKYGEYDKGLIGSFAAVPFAWPLAAYKLAVQGTKGYKHEYWDRHTTIETEFVSSIPKGTVRPSKLGAQLKVH